MCHGRCVALAIVLLFAPAGEAAPPVRVPWEGLAMVTGNTVRIVMPDGAVITGKASAVEADALLVDVRKTSHPKAYPKGELRVPRARLRVLEMQTQGAMFRILGMFVGTGAGLAAGVLAALAIDPLNGDAQRGAIALPVFFGVATAGGFAGYRTGSALDRHWTTVEIVR